jgi:hypothetical protein
VPRSHRHEPSVLAYWSGFILLLGLLAGLCVCHSELGLAGASLVVVGPLLGSLPAVLICLLWAARLRSQRGRRHRAIPAAARALRLTFRSALGHAVRGAMHSDMGR